MLRWKIRVEHVLRGMRSVLDWARITVPDAQLVWHRSTMYCEECFTKPTQTEYPFIKGAQCAHHHKLDDPIQIWDLSVHSRFLCTGCWETVRARP